MPKLSHLQLTCFLVLAICCVFGEAATPCAQSEIRLSKYEGGEIRNKIPYCNNLKEGTAQYFLPNGTLGGTDTWKGGKKNGRSQWFYENGQLKTEEDYQEDKDHGIFRSYFPDGKLMGYRFNQNGEENGVSIWFHQNGQLKSRGSSEHGKKHGEFQFFNPDGSFQALAYYDKGKELFSRFFNNESSAESGIKGIKIKVYYANLPPYGKLLNSEIDKKLAADLAALSGETESQKLNTTFTKIAPFFAKSAISFWKEDLNGDGTTELLVGLTTLVNNDPYYGLYIIKANGEKTEVSFKGPFLGGSFLKTGFLGGQDRKKTIFIKHQSCTECHPTIYLSAIDFRSDENGMSLLFDYSGKNTHWAPTMEYQLPGMGHSVEADVETRTCKNTSSTLLQKFALKTGKTEWWSFVCEYSRCKSQILTKEIPKNIQLAWETGSKL